MIKKAAVLAMTLICSALQAVTSLFSSAADVVYVVFLPEPAYLMVVQESFGDLKGGKYLSVDLADVKLADKTKLELLLREYCKGHGVTLLLNRSMQWLIDNGYARETNDMVGVALGKGVKYIRLSDRRTKENVLVINADFTGGGCCYAAKHKNGAWEITQLPGMWIV